MLCALGNVEKVLAGKPKRPAIKRDGTPQSEGNVKFKHVHLILAVVVKRGWEVKHYPLENVQATEQSALETRRKQELDCNMNDKSTWLIEDFASLSRNVR